MKDTISVLLAGRSKPELTEIEAILQGQPGVELRTRLMANGGLDPLSGVSLKPDVLLLHLSELGVEVLSSLGADKGVHRPPVVAIGPEGDTRIMRLAMQAGARDFFNHPPAVDDLLVSLQQVAAYNQAEHSPRDASLSVVVGAKGGAGTSFVAANLGHLLATHLKSKVALFDLDLQFGSLPLFFDMPQSNSLVDALEKSDHLDLVALRGYMSKHASGLHLLSNVSEQMPLPWEISPKSLNRLLSLSTEAYDQIILDLPRQIDPLTTIALERADNILLVMQQDIVHARDAKRLVQLMTGELAIPNENLKIIVNRYDNKSSIRLQDIQEITPGIEILTIPNDFKRISESINLGVPLFKHARNAAVTKSLIAIAVKLAGEPLKTNRGMLRSVFSQIFAT